jgi:hypothetical protein
VSYLGTVLSLCDRTGNMVEPWIEAGFRAVTVDMRAAAPRAGRVHLIADVRALPLSVLEGFGPFKVAFAAPPCTDVAVSGARWFKTKGLDALIEALLILNACRKIAEWASCAYAIENPVSTFSTYWRKPDYRFNPFEYAGYAADPDADAYTKLTCLWAGAGFVMPPPRPVAPALGSKMHLLPPSDDRADLRSETPMGFSRAVFEANA